MSSHQSIFPNMETFGREYAEKSKLSAEYEKFLAYMDECQEVLQSTRLDIHTFNQHNLQLERQRNAVQVVSRNLATTSLVADDASRVNVSPSSSASPSVESVSLRERSQNLVQEVRESARKQAETLGLEQERMEEESEVEIDEDIRPRSFPSPITSPTHIISPPHTTSPSRIAHTSSSASPSPMESLSLDEQLQKLVEEGRDPNEPFNDTPPSSSVSPSEVGLSLEERLEKLSRESRELDKEHAEMAETLRKERERMEEEFEEEEFEEEEFEEEEFEEEEFEEEEFEEEEFEEEEMNRNEQESGHDDSAILQAVLLLESCFFNTYSGDEESILRASAVLKGHPLEEWSQHVASSTVHRLRALKEQDDHRWLLMRHKYREAPEGHYLDGDEEEYEEDASSLVGWSRRK